MNLSRLDGLDSILSHNKNHNAVSLPKPFVTSGKALFERIKHASVQGLGDVSTNPIIIAAHNVDGTIFFESENGAFYDVDGHPLAVDGLGNIFKKVASAVKTVTQTVAKATVSAAKVITTPIRLPLNAAQNILKGDSLKEAVKKANDKAKGEFKQFVSDTGKIIKLANKFFPVTILLRNGLLIILKLNLFGVAEKLKYAYLTDAQASAQGIDPASLSKVRGLEDTIAKIYEGAGGNKDNLKRAIINGKGNSDKNGKLNFNLAPATEYADSEEYRILEDKPVPAEFAGELAPEVKAADPALVEKIEANKKLSGLGQLGDPVTGASIAAGTGAIAAIAAKLKDIGEIFTKGKSLVKDAKSAVTAVKSLAPKKEPAPLPENPTEAQTAAYIAAQSEYDEYQSQVQAAGGEIQPDGTVMVSTTNPDGTKSVTPVTPSGGMSTGVKVALGVTAAAAVFGIGYMVFNDKPVKKTNTSLAGLPASKKYKSGTARKKPSSSKRRKSKSKVKNVTI